MPDLVVGAGGVVGRAVRARLSECGQSPWLMVRSPVPGPEHQIRVDFERLDTLDPEVAGWGTLYCCLGTTLRRAGSRAGFRRVDVDHVVALARLARRWGARCMVTVSSVGADPDAGNFYLRCKGEMERAVAEAGPPRCVFVRPSLLLDRRQEWRPVEVLSHGPMRLAAPLMVGTLRRYRPIFAAQVAAAMVAAAEGPDGIETLEYDEMVRTARSRA